MLEVFPWKNGKEEEKGNVADTPRSASTPGREGFCFGPSPGAGCWLSPRHIQTEPLGKRGAFLDTRRQRVNSNKEGEKAKTFLLDTKYFL